MMDPTAALLGLAGTLLLVAAGLVGHVLTRQTSREQVTVSREQLASQIEQVVTTRMAEYRAEAEGLIKAAVDISTVLRAEVARLQEQVAAALAEVILNRNTITAQAAQIAAQTVQLTELSGENRRCIEALLERDRREHARDQRDSVRSAHLRAAADA